MRIKNLRILFFLQKIEIVSNKNKILFIKVKKKKMESYEIFFCIKLINKKYNLINSQKDDFNIFILNDNEKVEKLVKCISEDTEKVLEYINIHYEKIECIGQQSNCCNISTNRI